MTPKAGLLYDTAVFKNDESILLHIRGQDCSCIEARYHRACMENYTKDYSNMLAKHKKESKESKEDDNPFNRFCVNVVEKRIISGEEVFTLKKLLDLMKPFYDNGDDISFRTARLKEKLQLKYPSLIFHQSKCKSKSDLVYNDCLTAGDVIDASIVPDDITSQESSQDEQSQDEFLQDNKILSPLSYIQNRELYHSAMFLKSILSKIETDLTWPPDSNDLKFENAAQTIPNELKHF